MEEEGGLKASLASRQGAGSAGGRRSQTTERSASGLRKGAYRNMAEKCGAVANISPAAWRHWPDSRAALITASLQAR